MQPVTASPGRSRSTSRSERTSPNPLQLEKARAIKNLDIEAAIQLEEQIHQDRLNSITQLIDEARTHLERAVSEHHATYEARCEQTRSFWRAEILQTRLAIDTAFQSWQRHHIEELSTLEKEYALAVVRERRRPVPARSEFDKQARRLAKQSDFQESMRVREKAKNAEQAELVRRRAVVDTAFDRRRMALIEHQKADLAALNTRLIDELAWKDQGLQEALSQHERTFLAAVRSTIQKAIFESFAENLSHAERKRIAAELAIAGTDITLQISGHRIKRATPTPASRTDKANAVSARRNSQAGDGSTLLTNQLNENEVTDAEAN
jgi:hypothetical protein